MESADPPPIPSDKRTTDLGSTLPDRDEHQQQDGVNTTADLVAGWLGGAVGVIAGNPFEVLKVRLQTSQVQHFSPSSSSSSSAASSSSASSSSSSSSTPKQTFPNSPRVGKSSTSPIMLPKSPAKPTTMAPIRQTTVASPAVKDSSNLRTATPSVQIPSTANSSIPTTTPSTSTSTTTGGGGGGGSGAGGSKPLAKEKPSIMSLYRSEGVRFFFAGAAGPILGLAFIDSAFFGLYGRVMQQFGQDRQDPNALTKVFLAGATAGAACALLETPIEVVKTRAQVESSPSSSQKLGSFRIASLIARKEGLRGFYIGGLMTSVHDGVSSGIFFATYFIFRRLLRGEHPFHQVSAPPPSSSSRSDESTTVDAPTSSPPLPNGPGMGKGEVARILLAGGLAGAVSALIPYPFDIVKTRLQTANFESRARSFPPTFTPPATFTSNATPFHTCVQKTSNARGSSPPPKQSVPELFRQIYRDSIQSQRYRYRSSVPYSFFSTLFPPSSSASSPSSSSSSFSLISPSSSRSSTSSRASSSSSSSSSSLSSGLIDGRPPANPKAEKWTLRVLGLKGFTVGLRPTVVSSFVGSAATITTVEVALHLMGANVGVGVG